MIKTDKTLYYIDTCIYGQMHEMFNAALLKAYSYVFTRIECRANHSNSDCIRRILSGKHAINNIIYKNVFVWPDTWIFPQLRYLFGALLCLWYTFSTPRNAIVVIPYNNPMSIRALNFFNKIFKRRILIYCHGELGALDKLHIKRFSGSWFIRDFFMDTKMCLANNLYFSVIGDGIFKNLIHYLPQSKLKHFVVTDHPYIFYQDISPAPAGETLNIGTVGILNYGKGQKKFVEFLKQIPSECRCKVNLSVCGYVAQDVGELSKLQVEVPKQGRAIFEDRDIFEREICKLNYILFFHGNDMYKLAASGVIMDAIANRRPIIGLHNDYFDYLFNKVGHFGFLAYDTLGMVETLCRIEKGEVKTDFDFETIQYKLSPEYIAKHLYDTLKQIGWV